MMYGVPLSWVIALAAIGAVVSYIFYLKWQRGIAERKADKAVVQRDNAVVEQHATETALDAQQAYQEAHDAELTKDKGRPAKSTLEKLNGLSPLLLCLLMLGCASEPKSIEVNPASKLVLPSMAPLESWRFVGMDNGFYCLDQANADAFIRNQHKRRAHTKGLEAMLLKLGVKER